MSAAGGRAHALLSAVFCLALPGCQSTIQIPGSLDPNSPAIAVVEFRLPPNGPLATLPYDSYQFQWVGEWVSSDSETTDPSLQTDATQTITVPKDDIYLSRVATFPPLGSLRGGRWSIALLMTGGPNHEQIGLWPCVLPGSQPPPTPNNELPYLAPASSTLVTFQGHDDGSVTCTAALT